MLQGDRGPLTTPQALPGGEFTVTGTSHSLRDQRAKGQSQSLAGLGTHRVPCSLFLLMGRLCVGPRAAHSLPSSRKWIPPPLSGTARWALKALLLGTFQEIKNLLPPFQSAMPHGCHGTASSPYGSCNRMILEAPAPQERSMLCSKLQTHCALTCCSGHTDIPSSHLRGTPCNSQC